jgi:receptor expression-enhancing protein 1/2/3/4
MYYEAKVLFVLYLWHPQTQGAVYLFNNTLQPFLAKNEAAIDQALEEVKTMLVDQASVYFHRSAVDLQISFECLVKASAMAVYVTDCAGTSIQA